MKSKKKDPTKFAEIVTRKLADKNINSIVITFTADDMETEMGFSKHISNEFINKLSKKNLEIYLFVIKERLHNLILELDTININKDG